jgi:hypothetical protein
MRLRHLGVSHRLGLLAHSEACFCWKGNRDLTKRLGRLGNGKKCRHGSCHGVISHLPYCPGGDEVLLSVTSS